MEPHELGRPALLSLEPGDPTYGMLTRLAAAEARTALGKDVELDPEAVDRSGHWACVRGRLRDAGGASLSLQGTPFAEAAAAGTTSDLAVVLLRQDGGDAGGPGRWAVRDRAILPSDVAWLEWPRRHGAPSQLLGLG